ncbi:MAG: hypothetical protein WA447_16315 [Candidatus Binatus sp.]
MGDMELGAGVVVSDHSQTAGHRFQSYVSKGFGFAWEKKYVGGRVVFAKLFAHAHAGKNQIWIFLLQASTKRSAVFPCLGWTTETRLPRARNPLTRRDKVIATPFISGG